MTSVATVAKTSKSTSDRQSSQLGAGDRATTLVPPPYGIGFVDRRDTGEFAGAGFGAIRQMQVSPGSRAVAGNGEPEDGEKLRQDEIDRSFLGLGADDRPKLVMRGASVPPNQPISTGKGSTEAFDLNLAQRGFEFVGDLRLDIAKHNKQLADLNQRRAAAVDDGARATLDKEITKVTGRLANAEERLRLVSTPQFKDETKLSGERQELAKQLSDALKPAKKKQIEKKIAALDAQIEAVKLAKANPGQADLAAFEGTTLLRKYPVTLPDGKVIYTTTAMHTFVTIQVTTADGSILVFQARNVPGGDHAEDVVMKQIEKAGLAKGLAGAKMEIFGDQEVCARCQKRVPEFAEKYGIQEVEGYTTHAPSLKDPKKTISPKDTALEVSDPAAVRKREAAVAKPAVVDAPVEPAQGKSTYLAQKKTFAWRKPDAPVEGADAAAATPKTAPGPKATTSSKKAAPQDELVLPRKPANKAEAATGVLNKVDMGLAAIRDFKRYKQDYLAQGMTEAEANARAAARAGTTLGANARGGPLAMVVNAANAYDSAVSSGQGKGEAIATTIGTVGGGLISNKLAPTGPVGAAVQVLNTGAQALGAPQAVQDVTYGAAELVPSSVVSTTITAGARSWYTLGEAAATGDARSLDRLGKDMESGGLGPWIQGYSQVAGMIADVASGDDFQKALNKAGNRGKDSWANRVGSGLADAASDLGEDKEAMAGKYGPIVGGYAIALNVASGLARGEDFSQAFAHTQKDFTEGKKTLDVKVAAKGAQVKAAVRAKVDIVKAQAAKVVDAGTKAVSATVEDVKAKAHTAVEHVATRVNTTLDTATTALTRHAEAGEAFVREKIGSGTALLGSAWKTLRGD